jgi:hypothetical protein
VLIISNLLERLKAVGDKKKAEKERQIDMMSPEEVVEQLKMKGELAFGTNQ